MSNKEEDKFKFHLFGTALFSFIMSVYYITGFDINLLPDSPLNFFIYTFLFWIIGFVALGFFIFVFKIKQDILSFFLFYIIILIQPLILNNI